MDGTLLLAASRRRLTRYALPALALVSAVLSACSQSEVAGPSQQRLPLDVASISVALNPTSINVGAGSSGTATVRDANNNVITGSLVSWSSSDTTIAAVNSYTGLVTGIAAGSASIAATSGGKSGAATITIAGPPSPPSTAPKAYFNSSEAGCGSDPNVILCDDFESGTWYTKDCDQANSTGGLLQTKGWCGTIYANPISPAGAASCGGKGANNTNCAANGGLHVGQGGVNMADHQFAGGPVTEIWARWYYKTDAGYQWGAEKHTNFTKAAGDITFFNIQFNCGTGAAQSTATPFIQIIHGPSHNCWAPNQGAFSLQSGRWYYFEVHAILNSSGTVSDGLIDMWINDCGTTGVCSGTPTLRTHLANVGFDRNQTGCQTSPCKIETLWFENWANPASSGTGYFDQVKASKVGPIGF